MLLKIAESIEPIKIENYEDNVYVVSDEALEQFKKVANELKQIAPKAKDFLYFSTVMMTAAEASLYDENGNRLKDASGKDLDAHWEKNGRSWKWVCSDPKVMPYKNNNCFIAGTKIMMSDGSVKNIEDIKVGDEVITHKNRSRRVLELSETNYSGDLCELAISNLEKLTCTPDHPLYVAFNTSKDSLFGRAIKNNKIDYRFVEAKDATGYLVSPVLNELIESDITPSKARLLGVFAAEGCYTKDNDKIVGLTLTFGSHEYDNLADDVCNLFKKEFPEATINLSKPTPSQPTKCSLSVRDKNVANWFYTHVGEYSINKKLSKELLFAQDNVREQFIIGWLEGDGHVDKQSGKAVGTTVSKHLAYQINLMLNSMKINHSLYYENGSIGNIDGRNIVGGKVYRVKIPYNEVKSLIKQSKKLNYKLDVKEIKISAFTDKYYLHNLLEKKIVNNFNGKVYNFEVEEDHSYVANGVIVHNCDIFPESELIEAHKKWVGRPLCLDHKSSSVDMIRGIVVDTYYDKIKKRVVALCALDKVNYPDLARKVATGVSNNVSMGTGVNEAICTDCGQVARVEADFCQHMRQKSCYGEINVGLNPIELSIVVNGADPRAKIKHIIAAANSIAQYVEMKKNAHEPLSADKIDEIIKMLNDLKGSANEDGANKNENCDSCNGHDSDDEHEAADTPAQATATEDESTKVAIASIEEKISVLAKEISKLTNIKEDDNKMTSKKAYFQGAGGVNEPTPGKPKYEKEEADKIRNGDDKHLNVVDTGPVDGLFPGDEAKKKELLRAAAEQEERAMKREAALKRVKEAFQRKSYFQNGDDKASNPNTPTPGKAKYEKQDSDSVRDKEDKHMVGAPPFPGVGKVDGLYDGDEATKKKLLRAKLKATFVKAASPDGSLNRGDSRWSVFADDKLILTATVKEISGNRVDALYDTIATKDFGKNLLAKLKTEKFEKVAAQLKGAADEMAPPAAPAPTAPPAAPAAGSPPEGEVPEMPTELSEDPKAQTGELINKLEETLQEATTIVSDLAEAHNADSNKEGDELAEYDQLAQQPGAEQTGVEAPAPPAGMPTTASLINMQRKLSSAIRAGIKTTVGDLRSHIEELKLAHSLLTDDDKMSDDSTRETVHSIVEDALEDAKHTVADSYRLMEAFVKYARGTEALVKRAGREMKMIKQAQQAQEKQEKTNTTNIPQANSDRKDGEKEPVNLKPNPVKKDKLKADDLSWSDDSELDMLLSEHDDEGGGDDLGILGDDGLDEGLEELEGLDDVGDVDLEVSEDGTAKVKGATPAEAKQIVSASYDLSTKEGRAAWRTKLAEKGMQYSDMLTKAHPSGGFTTQLDTKPAGDLAKVETLQETHDAMMDVANAPPKVRKMAEEIQKYVTAGKIDPEKDFPTLISQGLDQAAVKYWKQFWGEAKDGGSQFAADLIKEHVSAKQAEEQNSYRVKIARAYDMAYAMAERGMIGGDHSAINEQVNEIMNWNDENFDSLKRLIARQPVQKKASMPQVGMLGTGEVIVPTPAAETSDLRSALNAIFANKKY